MTCVMKGLCCGSTRIICLMRLVTPAENGCDSAEEGGEEEEDEEEEDEEEEEEGEVGEERKEFLVRL